VALIDSGSDSGNVAVVAVTQDVAGAVGWQWLAVAGWQWLSGELKMVSIGALLGVFGVLFSWAGAVGGVFFFFFFFFFHPNQC
jgi:hypothetical protein